MDSDECKAGSAESENGSDNSYVQVTKEDARLMMDSSPPPPTDSPQLVSGFGMPPEEDFDEKDATIYEDSQDIQQPEPVQDVIEAVTSIKPVEDPFYMESHEEEEEEERQQKDEVKSLEGIEDVKSGPVSSTAGGLVPPKPTGYLTFLHYLHPIVLYIIYWQDVKLSAVVLCVDVVVLLTLTLNTFLHTIILILLSFLVVSLSYIVIKIAIDSFYNRNVRNPFSEYLNHPITLPEDKVMEWVLYFLRKFNQFFNVLVRLLLFDNIKQSLKFGLFLWLTSFVTNCVNILTAMNIATVLLFGAPPLYSKYQKSVDGAINKLSCTACEVYHKVRSNVPFLKKSKVE